MAGARPLASRSGLGKQGATSRPRSVAPLLGGARRSRFFTLRAKRHLASGKKRAQALEFVLEQDQVRALSDL